MHQDQAAKCVLKLNTPVLNILFPEGTEARVQLQQAVLEEVSRVYVKTALSTHVQEFLRTLTQQVKNEADIGAIVATYFQTSGGWNSVASLKPDTQLTKALTTAIEKAFDDKFYALVEQRVADKVFAYEKTLDSKVGYAVDKRVEQLTNQAIQKRVDAALSAARMAL